MRARLLPCPSCHRHSRIAETHCPFCDVELGERIAPPVPSTAAIALLSRTARIALGAALAAVSTAGCGGAAAEPESPEPVSTTQPPDDQQKAQDPGGDAPPYGIAPEPQPAPGPDDDGAAAPEYGAPAPE